MRAEAVLYVVDLDRQAAFYRDGVGLEEVERAARYVVLRSAGWTLHLVRAERSVVVGDPPERRSGTPIKLAFAVPSIDGVRARLAELGGRVEDATTAWTFLGSRRCDALDPEGNVVQLLEPDRPVS